MRLPCRGRYRADDVEDDLDWIMKAEQMLYGMAVLGPTASSSVRLVFDPLTSAVPGRVFACEL